MCLVGVAGYVPISQMGVNSLEIGIDLLIPYITRNIIDIQKVSIKSK